MTKQKRSKFRGKTAANAKQQKQQESNYGYLMLPRNVSIFQPEPGKRHRFDILPYIVTDPNHPDRDDNLGIAQVGDLWYKRPFKIHRNIGGDNNTVVCLTSIGKKCPICEYRAKMFKEGAAKEDTDALKPSSRNLYIVIPEGSEDIHIWDVSQYLFQNLLNDELEENEEYEVFPDLEEGLTLKVRFDSSTIGSSKPFAEASRIDFEERDAAYEESILDEVPDLDNVLKVYSYSQLEAMFLEIDEPEEVPEDDEPEETIPTRRKKKVIEDDEEDEENESLPKRSSSKRTSVNSGSGKSSIRRKPEPEEEEEEEEEEEPTPTRRTVRKKQEKEPEEEPEEAPKRKRSVKSSQKSDEKCPHGHRFGIDTDEFDECDDCKIWDDCIDEKEKEK